MHGGGVLPRWGFPDNTILAMGAIALKVEEGWGGLEVLLEVFDGDPGVNKNIS